ncbi:MAG: hypothetical protein KBB39_09680 [Phycicoccus sp.]|nr:hypothetical protein [Phycicoccus sp.]
MSAPTDPMRIEVVCTGNVCRSPYVQVRLQAALDAVAPGSFAVTSSGTHALRAYRPERGTRRALADRGLVATGLRSRQLTPTILQGAGLVLVMDDVQRVNVIDEHVAAAPRTFLINEFARLLQSLGAEQAWSERLRDIPADDARSRWKAVTRTAHQARGRFPATADEAVPDPYKQKDSAFDAMADELDRALSALVELERQARRDDRAAS